jgi:hypothetical protein
MAEVMQGHMRFHVLSPNHGKTSPQVTAADEFNIFRRFRITHLEKSDCPTHLSVFGPSTRKNTSQSAR